jgi:WD40 repeat protein
VAGPRDLAGSPDALQPNRGEAAVDSLDGLVATVDHPNELLTAWGSVTITDIATKRTVGFVGGGSIGSIAYAGRRLLVQRTNGQLEVWNPRGTSLERILPGDQSYVWPPVGSADGALVARRRADGSITLGDLDTGATLATFPAPADPSLGLSSASVSRLTALNMWKRFRQSRARRH